MRVKERHRGEEELQEGCVSFRASEGHEKGATHLSCIRGEQAVLEDRQAPGHGQKKKRESYKRCHGRKRQGVAGIRGVQARKQRRCLILHPRSAAGGKPCSAGADVGRSSLPQPCAKC